MTKLGENLIAGSGLPPFFVLADEAGVAGTSAGHRAPALRYPGGDAVRASVRSLSGFQKEALVASAATGRVWRLASDEGAYLNGHDAAPCPLAFLSAGMAASFMREIEALAKQREIAIRSLRLTLDNYYTMTGSMPKRTMVGGAENVELGVEIDCDLADAELDRFLTDAIYASPLAGLMRGTHESLFKLARNDQYLPTAKVAELEGDILADPAAIFDDSVPEASDLVLMEPVGVTPKKEVALGTAAAASSLAAEQNRRLNIGAVAQRRADGILDIQQMQHSPHGTSFRFLSSEDGRAPDANALIAAGVGFCFMTQFGRFVSMLKLDLPDYRIVQDMHMSPGGASGKTGTAGQCDPVETHVFLETSEPDETAQEMLDISEQTCFLHAFCRTDLRVKLKVHKL